MNNTRGQRCKNGDKITDRKDTVPDDFINLSKKKYHLIQYKTGTSLCTVEHILLSQYHREMKPFVRNHIPINIL
jgi:hypothetical protein